MWSTAKVVGDLYLEGGSSAVGSAQEWEREGLG